MVQVSRSCASSVVLVLQVSQACFCWLVTDDVSYLSRKSACNEISIFVACQVIYAHVESLSLFRGAVLSKLAYRAWRASPIRHPCSLSQRCSVKGRGHVAEYGSQCKRAECGCYVLLFRKRIVRLRTQRYVRGRGPTQFWQGRKHLQTNEGMMFFRRLQNV